MDLIFGIILIAFSLFSSWLIFMLQNHYDDALLSAVLGVVIVIFLTAGIEIIDEYCYPSITPMDVYRGKTTLEITYKDSIAIDSTVVWKEEVK
jgi:hypothetical protein